MQAQTILIASFATLITVSGSAFGQAPSDTSPRSSENAEGRKLSHIGGTPVKVGEHNEYYYDFKRTNISSNPVGWMIGFFGVSASHAVHNNVAIRADVNIFSDAFGGDGEGFEVGVGLPLYLRRAYQGPFVEPGAVYRKIEDETDAGPQMLLGWHWTWDSGFNISTAFGFGRDLSSDDSHDSFDDDGPDVFVNGYFRVGYAF